MKSKESIVKRVVCQFNLKLKIKKMMLKVNTKSEVNNIEERPLKIIDVLCI